MVDNSPSFKFTKMHSLGNDFVMIDAIASPLNLSKTHIIQWADHHRGIGFDQLFVIHTKIGDDTFACDIHNRDGSEASMCGNGMRCMARFILRKKYTSRRQFLISCQGRKSMVVLMKDGTVEINMGKPKWEPQNIPLNVQHQKDVYTHSLPSSAGITTVSYSALSIGNPHAVIIIDDDSFKFHDYPLSRVAKELAGEKGFPQGVNLGLLRMDTRNERIFLRVIERGVGETLACGSGACAAFTVAVKMGLCEKHKKLCVVQNGGELVTHMNEEGEIFQRGGAEFVFNGNTHRE